jgi:hypothetical protein
MSTSSIAVVKRSHAPGLSGLQVILISDSEGSLTDFEDDGTPCCVCNKHRQDHFNQGYFVEFLKWGQCTHDGCCHWVHLKYCSPVRVLRRDDQFTCPCHDKIEE